jgi:hypothetical protein
MQRYEIQSVPLPMYDSEKVDRIGAASRPVASLRFSHGRREYAVDTIVLKHFSLHCRKLFPADPTHGHGTAFLGHISKRFDKKK